MTSRGFLRHSLYSLANWETDKWDLLWEASVLAITSVLTKDQSYKPGFLLSESGLLYLNSWGAGLDESSCSLKDLILSYFLPMSQMTLVVGKWSYSLLL